MWNTVKPVVLAAALSTFACGSDAPDTTGQGTASQTPGTSGTAGGAAPQAGRGTIATGAAGVSANKAGAGAAGATAGATAGAAGGGAGRGGQAGKGAAAGSGGKVAADDADAGVVDAPDAATGGSTGRAPLTSLKYPTTKEKVADAPTFNITRPMNLDMSEGKLPVIVWANGGCFRSDFTWTPLFERWASAGFVVLALTGSGSDDDIASMLDTTTKTEHGALIDWVEKANASGPYAGKLDLDRIVASGNSCGGVTALEVTAADKRVAAVFVLSGSSAVGSVNKDVMAAIDVPVGYVTGNPSEDVAAPNASDDYDAMKDGLPGMLVQRKMGDHVTVSTDEKILPEDAEIALNWMDLALYGTKQAYDMMTSPKLCENCSADTWNFKGKNLETLIK